MPKVLQQQTDLFFFYAQVAHGLSTLVCKFYINLELNPHDVNNDEKGLTIRTNLTQTYVDRAANDWYNETYK
jgi:hypothetical protein